MNIKFKTSNYIKFLFAIMLVAFEIFMIYITIYESPEIKSDFERYGSVLFILGTLYFTVRFAVSQVSLTHSVYMKAVRKFMDFKTLSDSIRGEVFRSIEFSEELKENLSKGDIKSFSKSFLISENWVSANKVLIPKKMIVGVSIRSVDSEEYHPIIDALEIRTIDGNKFDVGPLSTKCDEVANYLEKGNEIKNLKNTKDKEKIINDFKHKIKNKDDFYLWFTKK